VPATSSNISTVLKLLGISHCSPVSPLRITGNYIPLTILSQTLISKGSIWLNTNTQYMTVIKIANENTTNGVSGEPSKYLYHLFFL